MMELAALRRNKKNVSPVDGPLVAVVSSPLCYTDCVDETLGCWEFLQYQHVG